MTNYQELLVRDPTHAQVSLAGVNHALVPTHVLARDLPQELTQILGPELAPSVMYKLGQLIGGAHAKAFFANHGCFPELNYRVLSGTIHFAWAGYGDVELLIFEPRLDKNFLVLWESHNSFSAKEAIDDGIRRRACDLQAGYAAQWCEEATGLPIEVVEIACRAEGVATCRFVMTRKDRASHWVYEPRLHRPTRDYSSISARVSSHPPDSGGRPMSEVEN